MDGMTICIYTYQCIASIYARMEINVCVFTYVNIFIHMIYIYIYHVYKYYVNGCTYVSN